jgi:hypothetical protein
MKEFVKNALESYRRVGDLNGAVRGICLKLPGERNAEVVRETLKDFVATVAGKNYSERLESCAETILTKSKVKTAAKKADPKFKQTDRKEV